MSRKLKRGIILKRFTPTYLIRKKIKWSFQGIQVKPINRLIFQIPFFLMLGGVGLGFFGVKDARADFQADIAPSTESHTASVSTLTERSPGHGPHG